MKLQFTKRGPETAQSKLDLHKVFRAGRTDFEEAMRIGRMSPDEVISSTCDWVMVLASGFIKAWRTEGKTYPEAKVLFGAFLKDYVINPVVDHVIEAAIKLEGTAASQDSHKEVSPN